jgi:hypothetical protein
MGIFWNLSGKERSGWEVTIYTAKIGTKTYGESEKWKRSFAVVQRNLSYLSKKVALARGSQNERKNSKAASPPMSPLGWVLQLWRGPRRGRSPRTEACKQALKQGLRPFCRRYLSTPTTTKTNNNQVMLYGKTKRHVVYALGTAHVCGVHHQQREA